MMPDKAIRAFYLTMFWIGDTVRAVAVGRRRDDDEDDRGDVPGWVMITVMTSIMVIAILAIFGSKIRGVIENAFDRVDNGKTTP